MLSTTREPVPCEPDPAQQVVGETIPNLARAVPAANPGYFKPHSDCLSRLTFLTYGRYTRQYKPRRITASRIEFVTGCSNDDSTAYQLPLATRLARSPAEQKLDQSDSPPLLSEEN